MGIANLLLTVASAALLLGVLQQVWDLIGVGTVAMYAAFTAAALGAGHVMGGPDRKNSIVLAYSCASRHPGVAAIITCVVVQAIVCPLYVRWQRRATTEKGPLIAKVLSRDRPSRNTARCARSNQ